MVVYFTFPKIATWGSHPFSSSSSSVFLKNYKKKLDRRQANKSNAKWIKNLDEIVYCKGKRGFSNASCFLHDKLNPSCTNPLLRKIEKAPIKGMAFPNTYHWGCGKNLILLSLFLTHLNLTLIGKFGVFKAWFTCYFGLKKILILHSNRHFHPPHWWVLWRFTPHGGPSLWAMKIGRKWQMVLNSMIILAQYLGYW